MKAKQINGKAEHCLHLCNNANAEEVVFSYLGVADALVTNNVEAWETRLKANNVACLIKKPEEAMQHKSIVVDGSSLGSDFEKWEQNWEKQKSVVCVYNIEELDASVLKALVNSHDKMLLSVNKIRMVSHKELNKGMDDINPDIVENLVKRDLKNIVVSMLLSNPMCGTDLVKALYKKFKVFISPGQLYPTLHELEKSGLLKYECKLKNKIYSVQKEEEAKHLLQKHVAANSALSRFLMTEENGGRK
ncbi:MAG: PadR family transcriptional regulator [Nanoarchaeota archaeon]